MSFRYGHKVFCEYCGERIPAPVKARSTVPVRYCSRRSGKRCAQNAAQWRYYSRRLHAMHQAVIAERRAAS